jgi:Flp pilus assembly protein TadG
MPSKARIIYSECQRAIVNLRKSKRGNITVMMAFLLPILVGVFGVGFEISIWYQRSHAMQNAADAAAIAAATNGDSNYDVEAKAVAALYGFFDGKSNVTVTASNAAECPDKSNVCYSVKITSWVQLYLTQAIGYDGQVGPDGTQQIALTSTAVAKRANGLDSLCLLALDTGGQGIRSNGAPKADFTGCNVMSNSQAQCNGSDLHADMVAAVGSNSGCGTTKISNVPIVKDPYAALAINIPQNTCKKYPQEPTQKNDPPLPGTNVWSNPLITLSGNGTGNGMICGTLKLTTDVVVHTPDNKTGATLVIENGDLDLNGFKLSTDNGSALTIVFSGTNGGGYSHVPKGSGASTLNFMAPTSGPWSGVAIYQDPMLTNGVNIAEAGNNPTWDITGLVYLPHANVNFSGAVNKSSNGASCFVMVAYDVTISGSGSIAETGGCRAAGLEMPSAEIWGRGQLVG